MFEGVADSVIIDGGGDVVGNGFQRIDGVAHGDTDACGTDHRTVVTAVAEGNCVLGIESEVGCYGEETFAFVGTLGSNVGEGGMPTTRGTAWQTGHQLALIVGREEGRQLEDGLFEHFIDRLGEVKVLDGKLLAEDEVYLPHGVEDAYGTFANDDDSVLFLLSIADHHFGLVVGDGLPRDNGVANEAESTVGGDVAIDEMLDGTKVGDDDGRTARSDEDLMTIGLGLGQGKDGRSRNLVGLKAYQCPVDVEE